MSLAELFFLRFKGLDRAHGVFTIKRKNHDKNKMEGSATTKSTPPTILLWEKHLAGEQGLGIIPITDNSTCSWGAIDIDLYENFDLIALAEEIERLKLPLILCRTKSGGAHLYLFLKEETDAALVRGKLMEWAIILGHPNVEVFPKQIRLAGKDDMGNWLNMPYFQNKKTTRYAYKNGGALTAEQFLEYAAEKEITSAALKEIALVSDDEFTDAPPCLQHLCSKGFPTGTRNNGLFNLGIFAKQKYGDQWKSIIEAYNQKYMDKPLASDEVQRVIKSAEKKKDYYYRCKEQPIASVCNRQICLTRKYGIGNSSDDIGVTLNGLTKIETSPPTWIVAVNGIRIIINDTDELLSQAAFGTICVEKLNIWPNKIKAPTWKQSIDDLLSRVELIEAPEDASILGQLWHLIEEFCSMRAQAQTREQILMGRPFQEEGFTYFRSTDLLKYLSQRRYKDVDKPNKIWSILKEKGATTKVLSIQNKSCRVWAVPSFEKQVQEFKVPTIIDKEEF